MAEESAGAVMRDTETERLWLRRWSRAYATGVAEVNASSEVMEFLNGVRR